jgi:hypothetical protein
MLFIEPLPERSTLDEALRRPTQSTVVC